MCGFELGSIAAESQIVVTGSGATLESSIVRSGSSSLKVLAASGAASHAELTGIPGGSGWIRFYMRVTARPATTARMCFGSNAASRTNLLLNTNGTLALRVATTTIGTSSVALTDTTKWYMIEINTAASASALSLVVDGVTEVTSASQTSTVRGIFGCFDTVADTFTAYYDDIVTDNSTQPGPGAVVLLKPTSDSAIGTGWTLGTGTAVSSNAFDSVNNTPPTGVADLAVGSDPKQLRNAASAANSNIDVNLQTYAAAGISAGDTIQAVLPLTYTAAPVATSAKQGTVGVVSNPAITNVALASGGTAGAFWSGVAAGTFATGWKLSLGTLTTGPSVTLGTAPVMRVTQVTSSTRIAMVCFMGMYVDYTPAVPSVPSSSRRYPQLLAH